MFSDQRAINNVLAVLILSCAVISFANQSMAAPKTESKAAVMQREAMIVNLKGKLIHEILREGRVVQGEQFRIENESDDSIEVNVLIPGNSGIYSQLKKQKSKKVELSGARTLIGKYKSDGELFEVYNVTVFSIKQRKGIRKPRPVGP